MTATTKKPVKTAAKTAKAPVKTVAKKVAAKKAPVKTVAKKVAAKKAPVKTVAKKVVAKKAPVKAVAKKVAAKAPVKAVAKKVVAKAPVKAVAKKVVAKAPATLKPVKPATKTIVTQKPMTTAIKEQTPKIVKAPIKTEAKTPARSGPAAFEPYKIKKDEEYMSTAQKTHFSGILQQWRQDLMEEVDRTVHHMQDEAANFPDPNDRASQEEEFNLELRARDRERKLLKKIQEGLVRLDNDDYGYCEACGIEIGIRRLEARPTATLCIDCKTIDEFKEKQTGI